MNRIASLPPWLDRHFRVFDDSRRVADILVALAAGEREGRPVLLPRRGEPQVLPADAGDGFAVVLETSGTTGKPKRVRHSLARLRSRLRGPKDPQARWLLTYEPTSFAGLQVILTAAETGATLYAAPGADVVTLARLAADRAVTHISGTPSFWRGFLMASPQHGGQSLPPLLSLTLGGEAVDQKLLDALHQHFPAARLRHIYASSEAGALFAVSDGREGFPAAWLTTGIEDVRLEVRDGVLWVNSPRAMLRYEGAAAPADADGWLDTGDLVDVVGDRALFCGRTDGRVNVGGVKVSPEAAEAIILAVEGVAEALVDATPSPITGQILTATIVPAANADLESLRRAVAAALAGLAPAARPRVISFADSIPLSASGKKKRGTA